MQAAQTVKGPFSGAQVRSRPSPAPQPTPLSSQFKNLNSQEPTLIVC